MSKFIEIPGQFLAQIAGGGDRIPTLYYSGNVLIRRFFWQRLHVINRLITRFTTKKNKCLDFGGGAGVMLPTLSGCFREVTLLDLEVGEAMQVVQHYQLDNVNIEQKDVAQADFRGQKFDAIVAADVLEHFRELHVPVAALHGWLADDGLLFTSLPTENWVYVMLRKLFGITKPADHYHTAYEVEAYLRNHGFEKLAGTAVPLYFPVAPLFLISCWRKQA
jgi:predicted TPR repeat methyltransferase